ncbi:hypothetical protein [Bacillus mycoides]|uniref:hypothetical protein n=1 Tax=Bacillus mycoides TaxID=1405 RepID=UPI001C02FCBC|nr:hypothetical protein [Bacillus mycoides]QWG92817.1 hypothetical protein EXW40_27530 [Bacillus mycoides]
MASTKAIYRFVTTNQDGTKRTSEFHRTEIPFQPKGFNTRTSTRLELQMKPTFNGFSGPMWEGCAERPIIRYESTKPYEELLK